MRGTVVRALNTSLLTEDRREKVTITLRRASVAYADRKSRERGISRSELIDRVLAEAEEREIEALMAAGYQAMAGENAELAEEGLESFWEVLQDDSDWPTAPDKTDAPG
jgi:hypothetical protein